MSIHELDWKRADLLIQLALSEDLGENGDITTNSVIPENLNVKAIFLCKDNLICAGLPIVERLLNPCLTISNLNLQLKKVIIVPKGPLWQTCMALQEFC